jgi:serine/threonine protein kinase/WD40 repeat protein/tetratricopeptide (TPR) repeat protein
MIDASESRDLLLNQLADEFAARQRRGERPSLQEYCDRHPNLADDIRALFPALVELEQAKADAGPELAVAEAEAPPVTLLGDFRLLREVGRGGMGVVYEAEQISLGRRVALKLLPAAVFRDPVKKRRFEREAKAAAKLHHTNIVPVYGVGEHDGTPYYVMQFISGLGLDVVIDELGQLPENSMIASPRRSHSADQAAMSVVLARSLVGDDTAGESGWSGSAPDALSMTVTGESTPGPVARLDRSSAVSISTSGISLPGQSGSGMRSSGGSRSTYWPSVARIGVQVAGALAYAHKQGILHRDIKPANLLLDLDGIVWVTDFGLAKADDSDNLTQTGDLLGTFRYMSPEAFDGKSDTRSDVYGLGLTLFEMVALRPAYEERDRNKLIKQVTTGDPPRLRKLRRDAPRDLVTIVEKACERDPSRRYQSAGALADDLQRFLDGRPITARRATEFEKLIMWARRRPAIAGLVAALFLCLSAGVIISMILAVRADRFANAAADRERDATIARDAAHRNANDAMQTRNAAARQAAGLLLDRGIEDARAGEPARALHLLVRALHALPPGDPQSAPLERVIRANLAAWAETVPAVEHIFPSGPRFDHIAYSSDGEMIAMAVGTDAVQCFRTDNGRPVGPPLKIPFGSHAAIQFAADGQSLWVASPGIEKVVDQWSLHRLDPASGGPIQTPIPTAGPVDYLGVSPDGRFLVGAVLGLHPEDRGPAADAPGSRRWQTASIVVWEAATGRVVRSVPVNSGFDTGNAQETQDAFVSLSSDGKSVTAWIQRRPNLYEELTFTVDGNEPPVRVELPPLGSRLSGMLNFESNMRTALMIKDGQLQRWSVGNPGMFGPGVPTPFLVMINAPSADGRSVVSPADGRLFDTGAWPPRPTGVRFAHPGWQGFSGGARWEQSLDGRFSMTWNWVVVGGGRLWRLPRPQSRPALPAAESARQPERNDDHLIGQFDERGMSAVLWSNSRQWRGEIDRRHEVRLVDVATGATRATNIRHSEMVREVVLTPDGRYFATASFDSTARVWETATGRPASPPLQHGNYVATVAFSPDGNTLAAGDYGPAGLIKLWDWRTGKEIRPPLPHDDIVLSVTFSPDGRYLAALKHDDWSNNPELLVWEVTSGTAVVRMAHQVPDFRLRESVRFRPDGRAIATRDVNGVLRLWEIPSGKLIDKRPLDGNGVTRFSPDGRVVAAAANLGVRLLDGQTLAPLPAGYLPHPDPIKDVAFSPNGALLLSAHETGSAQLWDVATRKPIGPPAVLLGAIRAVTFTPDGKTCLCVAGDGTVRRWPVPVPFAEPDLARLADRVALMTGQRMDDNQGMDSIPADEWQTLRMRLVGDGSTAIMPMRSEIDWHDAVAADAEQDGDSFGAEWHLSRLAKSRPNDWTIPARCGRVFAVSGRRDDAAAAYDKARGLAPSPKMLADWLRATATDDGLAQRYDLALWNLDRATALTPDDWTLYAARASVAYWAGQRDRASADVDEMIRRGANDAATAVQVAELAGAAGDWRRATELFTAVAKVTPFTTEQRYSWAIACLKAGDKAAYRSVCAGIADQLPPIGPNLARTEARFASMALALNASATDEWSKPLAWIDHGLALLAALPKPTPAWVQLGQQIQHAYLRIRGALLYRAGRFDESAKTLREAMTFHANGGDVHDFVFLALAEHRLSHTAAANEAAAKARTLAQKLNPLFWESAESQLLIGELNSALPPSNK